MDLFFNELSLNLAPDRFTVHAWFHALGQVYKAASGKGLGEIKVPACFFAHAFAQDYSFFQWVEDREADQDLRTLLKSRITTTPVIEAMIEAQEAGSGRLFDCRCDGRESVGLGAASPRLFDCLALSMQTDASWDRDLVGIQLNYTDGEAWIEEELEVRHVFQEAHVEAHAAWLGVQLRPKIPNGQVLWLQRDQFFPNLIFCAHIRDQIAGFSGRQPAFIQLQKRLLELESYAAARAAGIFDPDALPSKVTTESDTRKRDFAGELTRVCPDGKTRVFDWHARFTPGAWRIHFYPLEESNRIIVGNIANQQEIK
ncbi:MAG: hypothetical protein KIPDCIKN_00625 [Haliscomenobacter sp.]|jgi:hypothetical protein|nr:hypothetical protein [Haliscomenobacter sp.]